MFNQLLAKAGAALARAAQSQTAPQPMLVLSVALAFGPEDSEVQLRLTADPATGDAATANLPFSSFRGAQGYVVPASVIDFVRGSLPVGGGSGDSQVIWLRLVRPYGFLGLVPWEAALSTSLQLAVLRLPAFPARVAERTDVLENIIVIDPPNQPELAADVQARLDGLLAAIFAGTSRAETSAHVFCSATWHRLLRVDGADERIHFWPPAEAPHAASAGARADLTPWTDWILAKVAGRGIDAVHLIGRAALGEAEGSYLMTSTPFETAAMVPDIELDLDGLTLLLGRAGAWSVSFTPAASACRDAVAYVADALAHRWPGAVLFHGGADSGALEVAARLLYAVTASAPPGFADGFLYCQPAFLYEKQHPLEAGLANILSQQALLLAARAPATERLWSMVTKAMPGVKQVQQSVPPAWLGATQRFLESQVFDGIRRGAPDVLMSAAPAVAPGAGQRLEIGQGAQTVLNEVHSVVERYLKQIREEPDDAPVSHS